MKKIAVMKVLMQKTIEFNVNKWNVGLMKVQWKWIRRVLPVRTVEMEVNIEESEVSSAKKRKNKTHNNDNEEDSSNENAHAEGNRIQCKQMECKSNESTMEMDQEGVASPDSGNGSEHEG